MRRQDSAIENKDVFCEFGRACTEQARQWAFLSQSGQQAGGRQSLPGFVPFHTWSQRAQNPDFNTFYIVPTWQTFSSKSLESLLGWHSSAPLQVKHLPCVSHMVKLISSLALNDPWFRIVRPYQCDLKNLMFFPDNNSMFLVESLNTTEKNK